MTLINRMLQDRFIRTGFLYGAIYLGVAVALIPLLFLGVGIIALFVGNLHWIALIVFVFDLALWRRKENGKRPLFRGLRALSGFSLPTLTLVGTMYFLNGGNT